MSNLDTIESHIHELLDIELYSAEEILKAEGCTEPDRNMSTAYIIAINRAKKIISLYIKHYQGK